MTGSLQLDDASRKWIAECLMLQVNPQTIIDILKQDGFSPDAVEAEIKQAIQHPYLQIGLKFARQVKKRDWCFNILEELRQQSPDYQTIERRQDLSSQEFLEQYYTVNRPVILTDALVNRNVFQQWTPEYLKQRCGEYEVEIRTEAPLNPTDDLDFYRENKMMLFADYIDWVESTQNSDELYMTGINKHKNKEMIERLLQDIPINTRYLAPHQERHFPQIWYGPAGTITPMHHDINNVFITQIRGRKSFKLISPYFLPQMYHYRNFFSQINFENQDKLDFKQFPQFRTVKIVETVVHPGETLFIPVLWWHRVEALDISLSIAHTQFRYQSDFQSFYTAAGEPVFEVD